MLNLLGDWVTMDRRTFITSFFFLIFLKSPFKFLRRIPEFLLKTDERLLG